ncbi:MAG: cell division protein FtsA, partial [Candidatus Cloacimonadota bacterium]|nr:cell division protein FtsA [Candidatus Cloacimonadota bacterium]
VSYYSDQFKCLNKIENINVSEKDNNEPVTVKKSDIAKLLGKVRSSIKNDKDNSKFFIQHIIPQYYILDNKRVVNPLNMSGTYLEVYVHIILADKAETNNLIACLNESDLEYKSIVAKPIASARAVLTEEEMYMGCFMMDIGGGTTDISYVKGSFFHNNKVELFGGKNVSFNIAKLLKTSPSNADALKIQYGSAISDIVKSDEKISVPGIGGRKSTEAPLKFLHEIIESNLSQLFEKIYNDSIKTNKNSSKDYTSGIVVTGGTSQLKNIDILIYREFNMPVRIGLPILSNISYPNEDLSKIPEFSTAIGLLKCARIEEKKITKNRFKKKTKNINFSMKKIKTFINKTLGGE